MSKNLQHNLNNITLKIGGKSGFSVPKNYFNKVEDEMLVKISEEQFSKEKPFNLPKDYFKNFEEEIFAKITTNKKQSVNKKGKTISLKNRMLRIVSYASVASVLLFAAVYFINNYNTTVSFNDITIAEIENWYDNGYGNTNNTEVATILETTDFNNDDLTSITFSNENIEEYFNDSNTATTLLFNETIQ